MEKEEYSAILANWVPPWLDDGKALVGIIEKAAELGLKFDGWLLLSLFLSRQLEFDLNRVRNQNLNIAPNA